MCVQTYVHIHIYIEMHKRHEETTPKQVSNPGEPSCPPLRLAPCAECCRKISCGPTRHRVKSLRRNTRIAGAAQPDRKGTRQQGGIDGVHTHATFEPINSPICPPCSTRNEGTWQGPPCQVSPDFRQATKIGARLGIRRTVQQLGAPANFKTLTARTRYLRRARLAQRNGRRARANTAPRRAGCACRHWSLCKRVEWAVTSRC